MQMSIEIKGLDSIVKNYSTAAPEVKAELNKAVKFSGVRVQREAKIEAPVRTGNLRSQIRFTNLRDGRGAVGSYAQYSVYVHEGTKHMKANPFMERALIASNSDIQLYFSQAIRNIGKHLARK